MANDKPGNSTQTPTNSGQKNTGYKVSGNRPPNKK